MVDYLDDIRTMSDFRKLDELHLEYESLLIKEIESMIGLAYVHGWRSENHEAGKKIRAKLRKLGSKVPEAK